ncbi:TPA: SGNH/GDSL hydrolase family protein [Vibrio alginolyticus]
MTNSNNFFELVEWLKQNVDWLNLILIGNETDSVEIGGVEKPSIEKRFHDRFSAFQAMVQGRRAFETKDLLLASGQPPAETPLAEVWNDIEDNNGLYGWTGSQWDKSPYDPIKGAQDADWSMLTGKAVNQCVYGSFPGGKGSHHMRSASNHVVNVEKYKELYNLGYRFGVDLTNGMITNDWYVQPFEGGVRGKAKYVFTSFVEFKHTAQWQDLNYNTFARSMVTGDLNSLPSEGKRKGYFDVSTNVRIYWIISAVPDVGEDIGGSVGTDEIDALLIGGIRTGGLTGSIFTGFHLSTHEFEPSERQVEAFLASSALFEKISSSVWMDNENMQTLASSPDFSVETGAFLEQRTTSFELQDVTAPALIARGFKRAAQWGPTSNQFGKVRLDKEYSGDFLKSIRGKWLCASWFVHWPNGDESVIASSTSAYVTLAQSGGGTTYKAPIYLDKSLTKIDDDVWFVQISGQIQPLGDSSGNVSPDGQVFDFFVGHNPAPGSDEVAYLTGFYFGVSKHRQSAPAAPMANISSIDLRVTKAPEKPTDIQWRKNLITDPCLMNGYSETPFRSWNAKPIYEVQEKYLTDLKIYHAFDLNIPNATNNFWGYIPTADQVGKRYLAKWFYIVPDGSEDWGNNIAFFKHNGALSGVTTEHQSTVAVSGTVAEKTMVIKVDDGIVPTMLWFGSNDLASKTSLGYMTGFRLCELSDNEEYDPDKPEIDIELFDFTPTDTVTVNNSDKIAFMGDSYTEHLFGLPDKAYICRISEMLDYIVDNHAISGHTYRQNSWRARVNQPKYHDEISWQDIKPKYAMMISYTNDLKYTNAQQYLNDLREAIEVVQGQGAKAIVSTEYHANYGAEIIAGMRDVARQFDCPFINLVTDNGLIKGNNYPPFWEGSHSGTRTAFIFSDQLVEALSKLPRPHKSLKIFTERDATSTDVDLLYNTNFERSKRWKEIRVGHTSLTEAKSRYFDEINSGNNSTTVRKSQYMDLLASNSLPLDSRRTLIEAVLPVTARNMKWLRLKLVTTDPLDKVYVRSSLAEPFRSTSLYQAFYADASRVNVGDEYTSSQHGDTVFTVLHTLPEYGVILCSPYNRSSATAQGGTLTRVSGYGDNEVSFTSASHGYDPLWYDQYEKSHSQWLEMQNDGHGFWYVDYRHIKGCIDFDKAAFMVKSTQVPLTIRHVSVDFVGGEPKPEKGLINDLGRTPVRGDELVAYPFVDTDSIMQWTPSKALVPFVPADANMPYEVSKIIEIPAEEYIEQSVSIVPDKFNDKPAMIEVWARYFPDIQKSSSSFPSGPITFDSHDYAELKVSIFIGSTWVDLGGFCGLHWKRIQIPTAISPDFGPTIKLRVTAGDKPIQMAKLSFKEV